MHSEEKHITSYSLYVWVLIGLFVLTTITVTVTWVDLSALTVAVALIIACIKAGVVLTYFMHLKFDLLLFRLLVLGVVFLFIMVIAVTFVDYIYR
jgi:cytochrome c oxidase subunit IV